MMRNKLPIGIFLLVVLLLCVQCASADSSAWYVDGTTLYVTGNLGDYRMASSSSSYMIRPNKVRYGFKSHHILHHV